MQIQPFMAHGSVKPFDIGILSGLARLDIHERDLFVIGPIHQRLSNIFRPIV